MNWPRLFAGIVSAAAFAGLVIQLRDSTASYGSVGDATWEMARYFTILTNLLVAIVFGGIAAGSSRLARNSVVTGVTMAIALVGVIYHLLLAGLSPGGEASLANLLLHTLSPVLAVAYWAFLSPKGGLSSRHAFIWCIYPLAYLPYALARGGTDGVYPYPFINVTQIGWAQTGVNAAVITVLFLSVGLVVVWTDGRLGSVSRRQHSA
ncbi:MAG: Pr6Pr family membrane protein [Mesorhizobium sp.]